MWKQLQEIRTEEARKERRRNLARGKDYSPRGGKVLKPRKDQLANTLGTRSNIGNLLVWDTRKSISMQSKSMKNISREQKILATSRKSVPLNLKTLTFFSAASLAKVLASQVKGAGSTTQEVRSFLTSVGFLNKSNHALLSLRMSKGYYLTTRGELSALSSPRLMSWGMTLNGKCLTARISAFPKTANGCSLSDILEEHPHPRYFLSEAQVRKMKRQILLGGKRIKVGTLRTHKDGEGFREMKTGVAPTLNSRAREDGSQQGIVIIARNQRGEVRTMDVAGSLTKSRTGTQWQYLKQGVVVRRFTPLECERLQGFPDGYTEGLSDTQRYKVLGNAVSVPVLAAIFDKLL